jgi:hypothetical protein
LELDLLNIAHILYIYMYVYLLLKFIGYEQCKFTNSDTFNVFLICHCLSPNTFVESEFLVHWDFVPLLTALIFVFLWIFYTVFKNSYPDGLSSTVKGLPIRITAAMHIAVHSSFSSSLNHQWSLMGDICNIYIFIGIVSSVGNSMPIFVPTYHA